MRMATLGLIQDEDITDDKAGRAIGIKPGAHVKGAAQFAENPLDSGCMPFSSRRSMWRRYSLRQATT
jgi:hypothetical protein